MPRTGPEYAQSFLSHRSALLDLLEHLPEDQGNFAAWEGAMTFKGLLDHLNSSSRRMRSMMAGQKPEPAQPSASFAEAKAVMQHDAPEIGGFLSSLTEDDLSRTVAAFGGMQMPISALVAGMLEHEIHHKGQIWMMARMIGVQPPMFARLG